MESLRGPYLRYLINSQSVPTCVVAMQLVVERNEYAAKSHYSSI